MANIILTSRCNIKCPFCFASENNSLERDNDFSLGDILELPKFLGNQIYKFCGGEPTLNNNLMAAMNRILENRNSVIILLTNGLWSNKFLSYIKQLDIKQHPRIYYLFNILPFKLYNQNQKKTINNVLSCINPHYTTLSITIYSADFEFRYLIELALKYKIKNIRWSIAAPNIGHKGLNLENDFYRVADRLCLFLDEARSSGIKTQKDCSYIPPCYFNKEKLLDLILKLKNPDIFRCSTSPIDIDCHGNAWRCYGLYNLLNVKKNNFSGILELEQYFDRHIRFLNHNLKLKEDCHTCHYYDNLCGGGCYANRVNNALIRNKDIMLFPFQDDTEILNCIPLKEDIYTINDKISDKFTIYMKKNAISVTNGLIQDFLSECNEERKISEIIDKLAYHFSSIIEAKDEIITLSRTLFDKDIISFKYSFQYNN